MLCLLYHYIVFSNFSMNKTTRKSSGIVRRKNRSQTNIPIRQRIIIFFSFIPIFTSGFFGNSKFGFCISFINAIKYLLLSIPILFFALISFIILLPPTQQSTKVSILFSSIAFCKIGTIYLLFFFAS